MTVKEALGLIRSPTPVKLVVHVTNGTSMISFVHSSSSATTMLSALGALDPATLDASVSYVDSENSKLVSSGGSFFNDGPAFIMIHVTRRTIL